jgi:HD-GYP domain-containing protein (c-di-GMP phosphodiesterase class II)
MDKLLAEIYASLNLVVFTHETGGAFKLHSELPEWLMYFCGTSATQEHYVLENIFPYLSCFMEDAEQHWRNRQATTLTSGSWLEVDALGHELALEASALWVNEQPILLLQNLGEKYYQEVHRLQQVRNGLLTQEMLENEIQKRTLKIKQREEEIAIKLVSLTSYRDEETGAHVRRIGLYAAAMAKALNWPAQRVDDIRIAAPMHDLGKIGIPDRILLKAGKLTEAEFSIMKRHTELGAKMLEGTNIPVMDMAAEIALCHHEKWDGTGYPRELAGEEIPASARITTIVDIYDALVHERVYKKAMTEKDTLALMKSMAGNHLDPALLEVFFGLLPVMRRIRSEVHEIGDLIVCA